jgi:uncharacterized protein Smg (DUF494 family)
MGSRVLEIVVYLMDHMRENQGALPAMDDLSTDLRGMGYTDTEISSAYSWVLDRFESLHETFFEQFPAEHFSNRILTQYERLQLTTEAYGYLLKLMNLRVIDDQQFESILERAVIFGARLISLDQIKMVTSAVLFNEFGDIENTSVLDTQIDPTLNVN